MMKYISHEDLISPLESALIEMNIKSSEKLQEFRETTKLHDGSTNSGKKRFRS